MMNVKKFNIYTAHDEPSTQLFVGSNEIKSVTWSLQKLPLEL